MTSSLSSSFLVFISFLFSFDGIAYENEVVDYAELIELLDLVEFVYCSELFLLTTSSKRSFLCILPTTSHYTKLDVVGAFIFL